MVVTVDGVSASTGTVILITDITMAVIFKFWNPVVLITDTTYSDEEYETKVGWGHSCVSKVVELAHNANVEQLFLFHHGPDQDDADIDAKLETATAMLAKLGSSTRVIAPREGERFKV